MSIDIATLVYEIDSTQVISAEKHMDALERATERLDRSARKVSTATELAGITTRKAGEANRGAAQSMGAYEQAIQKAMVTFAQEQKLQERNAQFRAAQVIKQVQQAEAAAKAEVAAARLAAAEQAAAAQAAAKAQIVADREAERSAAQLLAFRMRMAKQRAAEEARAIQEVVAAEKAAAAEQAATQRAQAQALAGLEARIHALKSSIDPTYAAQSRLDAEMKEATSLYRMGAISATDYAKATAMLDERMAAAARGQGALNGVMVHGTGSSKALTQAGLNLSRQFADIGVTAAMGMNPLMILIQQGPQVADAFAMAKTQGLGFSAVMRGLLAEAAPLLAVLWPIALGAAAIGTAFAVSAQQINAANPDIINSLGLTQEQIDRVKDKTVTMGDVMRGTWKTAGDALMEAFGPQITAIGDALGNFYQWGIEQTVGYVKQTLGDWIGYFNILKALWNGLPAAVGEALVGVGNVLISSLERQINGAITLFNGLIAGANFAAGAAGLTMRLPEIDAVHLARVENQYAGAGKKLATSLWQGMQEGQATASRVVDGAMKSITANTLLEYEKRVRKAAGAADLAAKSALGHASAVREQATALDDARKAADQYVASLQGEVDRKMYGADALKEREAFAKASAMIDQGRLKEAASVLRLVDTLRDLEKVQKAANDNTIQLTHVAGDFGVVFESATDKIRDSAIDAEEQIRLISNAVGDLAWSIRSNDWVGAFSGLLRALDTVKKATGSLGLGTAIGATATAAGSVIGGKAGGIISGIGSGAALGAQLGSIVPGIGNAVGAALGAALGGLGSLFGGNKAKKQAQQQAAEAEAQRQAQIAQAAAQQAIELMKLQGKAEEALAAERKIALAGMDATLHATQQQIWALEDQAAAAEKAAQAEQALAEHRAAVAARAQDIQLQILDLEGKATEALAIRRAMERAEAVKLDASLGAMIDQLYAAQDAATAAAAAEQVRQAAEQARLDAQAKAEQRVSAARDMLQKAYDREASALQTFMQNMRGVVDGLSAYGRTLATERMSVASPFVQFDAAQADFRRLASMGATSPEAAAALQEAGERYRQSSKYQSSSLDYLRNLAEIETAVGKAQAYAEQQVSDAQVQLDLLNSTVEGLLKIDESVLSVRDAISALKISINVQASAAAGGGYKGTGRTAEDWASEAYATKDASYLVADGKFEGYTRAELYAFKSNPFSELTGGAYQAYQSLQYLKEQGYKIPGFATGGMHIGGYRIVGEVGPELEATGPSRIYSADQTRQMFGGGGNGEVVGELRALRGQIESVDKRLAKIEQNSSAGEKRAVDQQFYGVFVRGEAPGEPVKTKAA